MKNILYYLSLCLFLFSCKKDSKDEITSSPSASKKYAVTFNASNFTQEVSSISKDKGSRISESPLKGMAAYFLYVVYDESGKEVSLIHQDSSGTTTRLVYDDSKATNVSKGKFGIVQDSLPNGHYTAVMIASNSPISFNSRQGSLYDREFLPFQEAYFQYRRGLSPGTRTSDTFFKQFKIVIVGQPIDQAIRLERIVGKLQLNILDGQLAANTQYHILINDDHEKLKVSNGQSYGGMSDFLDSEPLKIGLFNASAIDIFVLNTSTPIGVTIVYTLNGVETYKRINNVRIHKNKRTILTGNLFTQDPRSVGFTVKVDDQYDEEDVEVSF